MEQQEMRFRRPDKNGQFRGGKRKGAGRPRQAPRDGVPHRKRELFDGRLPVHVTLRVVSALDSLRKRDCYKAIGFAVDAMLGKPDFRIVHISIQSNHIHLLVEASGKTALARGIQAFEISAAKHLNRVFGARTEGGERRKGRVFADRYHREVIDNPRQARNALSYVLNNWRRHREDKYPFARGWKLDPYSSASAFPGWKEIEDSPVLWKIRRDYDRLSTSVARTWLVSVGWQRGGVISAYDVPGA